MVDKTKLEAANTVLKSFQPTARIERRRGGFYLVWMGHQGEVSRRWACHGQDWYPVWHNSWPGGGTSLRALAMLIRWLRDQPVMPISAWRFWASETVALLPPKAVGALEMAGYPRVAHCVLCGLELTSWDWWSLNGVTGPCCRHNQGCKQKVD